MRRHCFALLLLSGHLLSAQHSNPASQTALIRAELEFALMAKETNTRDAFLFFLSDDAITAAPGAGPRKGKFHLEAQVPDETLLTWRPAYSDVSISGDFGYNTGPWEFRKRRSDTEAIAYGQFASVWKKNENGQWRVAIDMGVPHGKPLNQEALQTSTLRGEGSASPTEREALTVDSAFNQKLKALGSAAYEHVLSEEVRFLRAGHEPILNSISVRRFLETQSHNVSYVLMGGGIATSGDLSFAYGTGEREGQSNGKKKTAVHSYLRVWKKRNGQWQLVLDVLTD